MAGGAMRVQNRGVVMARGGMVASAHPLVSAAGLRVLQEGGNAADAAVAMAALNGVALPSTNGIGGDMFCLYYDAASRSVTGFNGNGAAGAGAQLAELHRRGHRHMPPRGPLTVTVPGAVDGFCTVRDRFGTMPLTRLFAPAIHYAEEGVPVSERLSTAIGRCAEELVATEPVWTSVYAPGGRAPRAGEVLVQRDLGRSLRTVAEGGRDAFYTGELARKLVETVQAGGGFLTEADLAVHATEVYAPLRTTYRGLTVHETQPPSQGFIVLEMLNLLEPDDLGAMGLGSAAAVHRMVEAKKVAFADRYAHMGDPRYVDAPTAELIAKSYAADRRRAIDPARARATVPAGMPRELVGDTTYFCVVDGQGNAASFIHTLYAPMGSGVMAPGTGITLTNRGRAFVLDEGHPNRIEPGKRTMHTLNCYAVTDGDELLLVGGTPGADSQPQWNIQTLTNLYDFGLNVQEALETPRWVSEPGSLQTDQSVPYELQMEEGFPEETVSELERMGHRIKRVERHALRGSVQVIRRDPATGVLFGGSDPRSDGAAMGI